MLPCPLDPISKKGPIGSDPIAPVHLQAFARECEVSHDEMAV
jgi:hypothetical protein